jgi:hypothetical protein
MLKVQCNVGGYNSKPITLLATINGNIATVARQHEFSEERIKPEFALIGNVGLEMDYTFTDKDFSDSINAYFEKSAQNRIVIDEKLARFRPDSKLEVDKIDTNGKVYRLEPSIENGQIAILVICLFAKKQAAIMGALDYFDIPDTTSGKDDLFSITTI